MRRTLRIVVYVLAFLAPLALRAQEPATLEPAKADVWHHYIKPLSFVHVNSTEWDGLEHTTLGREYVEFKIVVSPTGSVESADSVGGVTTHLEEARRVEMARHFKPWLENGSAISVRIRDQVQLVPPERWAEPNVPFPPVTDMSQVRITLDRTRCYGTCPDYMVTISGGGDVNFKGRRFVAIPGDHVAHIPAAAVSALLRQFRAADFFSALDGYSSMVTDNPTTTITLTVGKFTKTVVDYVGIRNGLPVALANLEDQIDNTAGTDRWISVDEKTATALTQEKWQFDSSSPENIGIYVSAIRAKNVDLINRFLDANTSPLGRDASQSSPLCTASSIGDLSLVGRMHSQIKDLPTAIANECLTSAARSGSLSVVRFWIEHGADPTAPSQKAANGRTTYSPFQCAILSLNPEVVREFLRYKVDLNATVEEEPLLIFFFNRIPFTADPAVVLNVLNLLVQAGVDVNARNRGGETAVNYALFNKAWLDRLVQGGADINARFGLKTPLIAHAQYEDAVRNLLADGADPTISNNAALRDAQKAKCEACAQLIQDAIAKRTIPQEK